MTFRLALCQMKVEREKEANLKHAQEQIRKAASQGANVISLPEFFNCPYSPKYYREYGEDENGPSVVMLKSVAKELGVVIVGGSIPELDEEGKLYNTSFIIGSDGAILGRHRKIHMFDIDVEGGISMRESDRLTAGTQSTVVDTEFCRLGVAVCYDVRFNELMRMMAMDGAELILIPGSFTFKTGEAHWDVTMRCRAIDNQVFFAANSASKDPDPKHYQTYAHSCIVDPWGRVLARAEFDEAIIYADIEKEKVGSVRRQLPMLQHRRPDLYRL